MTRFTGRRGADTGFTLIEAVLALLVASIIVAVAVPAFQGFHRSAQDRAAQDEISRVLQAEQAFRAAEDAYTNDPAALEIAPPAVTFHASDPATGVIVSLSEAADVVCLQRASASGTVFGVWASATEGVFYGQGDGLAGACPRRLPVGYEPGSW